MKMKKTRVLNDKIESTACEDDADSMSHPHTDGGGPSESARTWLSIGVAIHLVALFVSFTAVVEPSSLQQRLAALFQPYLRPTHFSADDLPVHLTHGNTEDQSHRVEITTQRVSGLASSEDVKWREIGPAEEGGFASLPGFAVSDRVARWLSAAAILAENDQPSLVADLLLPVVERRPAVQGIRIVRYPTDLNDIHVGVSVPYLARVVRSGTTVSLVQMKETRLSAQPRLTLIEPVPVDLRYALDTTVGITSQATSSQQAATNSLSEKPCFTRISDSGQEAGFE